MFEKLVNSFDCKSSNESIATIQEFVEKHVGSTSLPELNRDKFRERLWDGLFSLLSDPSTSEYEMSLCLMALKILIRDRTDLESLITKDRIRLLMKSAHLLESHNELPTSNSKNRIVEGIKCLYNVILNYNPTASMMDDVGVIKPLLHRIANYKDPSGFDIRLFDLKLLFLLTAFCPPTRVKVVQAIGGMSYFTALLESQLRTLTCGEVATELRHQQSQILSDELKTLFNVMLDANNGDICSPNEFRGLVAVLREYLLSDIEVFSGNLRGDVINLLTLVPVDCLSAITAESLGSKSKESVKESGLLAVTKILEYLDKVLTDAEGGKNPTCQELLPPVLLSLLHFAQSGSEVRKHIRKKVLPKLTEKDMFTRPEEGNTLRNKLCRLLTSPIINITDATADLLFVLCKESVGRMVKYTGYGNAAGLFARRGLMSRPLEYSSDSEGSDSEEYEKHKEFINPIVGCRTPNHPNPLEGMTEEQKEVLAMELVNSVGRLMENDLFKPCLVGPDGRPQPVEHVLQLQQNKSIQDTENLSDSDDD